MTPFTQNQIGDIHLLTAILALIFGTIVLIRRKGTRQHRILGHFYSISMLIMLITSFMIYRLFGGFGLFHFFSIISMLTITAGMIPAITRKPKHWIILHFSFMYWSVIGLYAAFVSEIFTRIPETPFFSMLGIATFSVIGAAYLLWTKNKKKWSEQFLNLTTKSK